MRAYVWRTTGEQHQKIKHYTQIKVCLALMF